MTDVQTRSAAPGIYYGWVMVGVLMILLSIGMGTTMYMYSVVAGAVGEEFSSSRLMLMLGSTGMMLMLGFLSPLLGRLLDKYPCKWLLIGGSTAMGLGFILIGLSTSIWMVVLSYVLLLSMGMATLSTLTTATLLTRWFVQYRGLAIGIATLGTQLGGFVYPPLFAAAMEAYSWRVAIIGLGVLVMAVVPLISLWLVADKPADKQLQPYGADSEEATTQTAASAAEVPTLPLLTLLRDRNFVLIVLIISAASATNTTLVANLSLFATDLGEPVVRGAFLVSLVALLGVFFSPLIGWLCDVISIRIVTVLVMLTLAASCLVFSLANSYPLLLAAALFQGIGGGGVFPLWASLVGHLYHTRVYGQVMGAVTLLAAIVTAAAPLLAGWAHDVTQSYRPLFLTLLVVLVLLSLLSFGVRVPKDNAGKYGAPG